MQSGALMFLASAVISAMTVAATPAEAQLIAYHYDGVYSGGAPPAPGLSDRSCRALPLTRIDIENGILRAWDGGRQSVKGFVTHDGFFNADYYFPGRRGVVFEGVIDTGGRLSGGIFDGGCAFVIEMTKAQ
ncbi:hypothetical protein [Hyphococcus sp.]|uniref:hypothetical protein n=1 Tax=Hyphococcus sp. TaxID=2038636 RepID=UPI003CCBFB4F